MKKIILLLALALALPLAAFAGNSVDFTKSGGTLSGTSSGLSLTGSTLIAVDGFNGGGLITGSNLGSFTFNTGALTGGSLQMGGTFAGGGNFTITGNGSSGLPNGVIFSVDEAVAIGERLSALLIAEYLNAQGTPAEAINAAEIVVADAVFGNASPLMEPTRAKARARLLPLLEHGVLPVVTGFNGATADGRPTTLGRGGSDFSSILSAALDASELWIWTDVDGIMSADPRLVPSAAVLNEVTYAKAAELAYNGAKVLHPRTL